MNEQQSACDDAPLGKLIIIDQSLKSFDGHHVEYNTAVGEAAARLGWTVYVAANRALPRKARLGNVRLLRIFATSWDRVNDRSLRAIIRQMLLAAVTGLLAALRWIPLILHTVGQMFARKSAWPRKIYGVLRNEAQRLRRAGRRLLKGAAWVLRKIPLLPSLAKATLAVLRLPLRWLAPAQAQAVNWRPFRTGIEKAIRAARAGSRDAVFIHTIRAEELEQVLHLMLAAPRQKLPRFHILLRRDAFEPLTVNAPGLGLKDCLEQFHESGLYGAHAQFYTDTEKLTEQHDSLSSIRFTTLPIPFRHELIDVHMAARTPRNGSKALNVVYLGDARPEKGYQHLLGMVQALWGSHISTGKVRFTFQSNFNIPGGQAGMADARRRIRQWPDDLVRMLDEPLEPSEYYAELADADIVLIPYEQENYRARSSGILAEALSAGKPVIVTADTWMADQVDDSRAVLIEEGEDLPDAVRRIADDYDAYASAARQFAPSWRQMHSPDVLADRLTRQHRLMLPATSAPDPSAADRQSTQPAANAKPVRNILYFMQADPFYARGGSMQVAAAQIRYLRRCGYRVYAVLSLMDVLAMSYDKAKREQRIRRFVRGYGFAGVFILHFEHSLGRLWNNFRVILDCLRNHNSLRQSLRMYRGIRPSDDLIRFVKSNPIDACFINYVGMGAIPQSLPLPKGTPIICEMIDILSHQFAIWNNEDVRKDDFATECRLLDRFDSIIAISPVEKAAIEPHLRRAKVYYAPQHYETPQPSYTPLAGCLDLAEVLHAGNSDQAFVDLHKVYCDPSLNHQIRRLRQHSKLDLLYASSYHPPNIRSFDWFYHQVFLPYLAPRGVNLTVAGTICYDLIGKHSHDNLFIAGRLDSLDSLYAACTLEILPIVDGAGTNIKTLTALSNGKPAVGTPMAFREIQPDAGYPMFSQPKAFAEAVLRLLASPQARLDVVARGYQSLRQAQRAAAYDSAMDAAFANALGDKALTGPPRHVPQPPPPELVQWDIHVVAFNYCMRRHIEGIKHLDRDVQIVLSGMESPHWRKVFRELYRAFMEDRTAPLLSVMYNIQQQMARMTEVPAFWQFVNLLRASLPKPPAAKGGYVATMTDKNVAARQRRQSSNG